MKKNVFYWALYDFANSIIMISFLFYFSQWVVIDSGKPDLWYNAALVGSSILFIAAAPVLGQRLDATKQKLAGLRLTSVITLALFFSTAFVTIFFSTHVLVAIILFTLGLSSYLITFVFYTPMIRDLATESNRAWVSGLGMGANYAGQVFGVLVVLPFATGALHLFGMEGRAQALLPAVILCTLFVLPMLLLYREEPLQRVVPPLHIRGEYAKIAATIRRILSARNLTLVLFGYFFVSNALLTFTNNFPIFLEKVYGAPDTVKSFLTAGILTLSALGSLVLGRIADKKGHKKTFVALLVLWVALFPLLAFSPSFSFAVTVCLVGGFFFGPVWSISRAMVADLAPEDSIASVFSFYTISERFATLIGPFVWSFVLVHTADSGVMSYNYAIVSMGALTLIALLCMARVKNETRTQVEPLG